MKNNLQIKSFAEYKKTYKRSVENPEEFWSEVANHFSWKQKWNTTLEWDFSTPKIKWFIAIIVIIID